MKARDGFALKRNYVINMVLNATNYGRKLGLEIRLLYFVCVCPSNKPMSPVGALSTAGGYFVCAILRKNLVAVLTVPNLVLSSAGLLRSRL